MKYLIFLVILCTSCTDVYFTVGLSPVGFACEKISERGSAFNDRVETLAYCEDHKECEGVCNKARLEEKK
jgi:hypothetical protein